jgi:hypothetical protein
MFVKHLEPELLAVVNIKINVFQYVTRCTSIEIHLRNCYFLLEHCFLLSGFEPDV